MLRACLRTGSMTKGVGRTKAGSMAKSRKLRVGA